MFRSGKRPSTFLQDERGTILTEVVIVLPMMVWAFIGLYTYWDAFRAINVSQKAAYTIADLLSRYEAVDPETFFDGLQDIMEYIIDDNEDARMRYTSVIWDADDNRYEVEWSRITGAIESQTFAPLTTATLQQYAHRIPQMADNDTVVILETYVSYTPAFDLGSLPFGGSLEPQVFEQFIATKPRFSDATCLLEVNCS